MSGAKVAAGAAVTLFVLAGLLSTQVIAESGERRLAFRDLTAELGAVEWPGPRTAVFRSRRALARAIRRAMPGGAPEPPAIDFAHREAILAAVGPRSSTGYDLAVLSVTERRDRVLVVLRELTPRLGQQVAARVTFPYRLITIEKTRKPAFFEIEGRP